FESFCQEGDLMGRQPAEARLFEQLRRYVHGHDGRASGGEHLSEKAGAAPDFKYPFPTAQPSSTDNQIGTSFCAQLPGWSSPPPYGFRVAFREPNPVLDLVFRTRIPGMLRHAYT